MDQVLIRDENRLFPVYKMPGAEELPMFAENRVHQRSSGNPYPNRVVMAVDHSHREEEPLRVITLENEYLKIELLPQLGGRIYSAMDKRTGYDFFYKQHVIKPALIGMLGSWISGGVEFNWPCHHRPGTYMGVDVSLEREEGGAVTCWMGDNEPLDRMKGMVGVRLAPGEARFDTRMRVFNRTPTRHSFLWWENAAVPVNENYRLIFPPDVNYVQFHYRKNVTGYPVASGVYNGIRMGDGVDISYHKNTRQPTSYFCGETQYDFFGGYDEGKKCGVIHVADRTVSVGKKMFTWAYSQLSRSWEKALTDTDGAYAELMASSYSLNQPDFAWLMPYESKTFSQMWYPVGDMGVPLCACAEAAVSVRDGTIAIQPTVALAGCKLKTGGQEFCVSGGPGDILRFPAGEEVTEFTLTDGEGDTLLQYVKSAPALGQWMPEPIPDNPTLDTLRTAQEAYLMGVHAEQYRDPAIRPDSYYREALKKEPEYVPALTALAAFELDHFRPQAAYDLAMRAWRKVTVRNYHPESGELQYLMGRILEALDREGEAYDWYMQAAWAQDARGRTLTRAAMLEGRRGKWKNMARLASQALEAGGGNEAALWLRSAARGHFDPAGARADLDALLREDPLHMTARCLRDGAGPELFAAMGADAAQAALDIAEDLAAAGENSLAAQVLENLPGKTAMTEYVRAWLQQDPALLKTAAAAPVGIAYPARPLEKRALDWACYTCPEDAKAQFYRGCILYAAGNSAEAVRAWETAQKADPGDWMVPRCLAVALYSHLGRRAEALDLLDQALEKKPHDAQLIWEKALVMTRTHVPPEKIAAFLEEENCPREDVILELCRAYNRMGAWDRALKVLNQTDFTPCEGGEHAVAEQYMFAHHALGRRALEAGDVREALGHFQAAQALPDHLGAGLWNEVLLVPHAYYEALCLERLGDGEAARQRLDWILCLKKDYFSDMHLPELPCWQALTERHLGHVAPAREKIAAHLAAQDAAERAADAGYYGTTPFFISYMEDPAALRRAAADWQRAMACFAAGDNDKARLMARRALAGRPDNLYAGLMC